MAWPFVFFCQMHPEWAPLGAARFLELVSEGAYDGTAIYRVVRRKSEPEAVQFGYLKDDNLRNKWKGKSMRLKDDPQVVSGLR
jgi:cyclophilin family peptidyl-prolyl cis-trans isomerase